MPREKLDRLASLGAGVAPPASAPTAAPKPPYKHKSGAAKRAAKAEREAAGGSAPAKAAGPGAGAVAPPPSSPPEPAPAPAPEPAKLDLPPGAPKGAEEKLRSMFAVDQDAMRRIINSPLGPPMFRRFYSLPFHGAALATSCPAIVPSEEALAEGGEYLRWCVDVYLPNFRKYAPIIGLGLCLTSDAIAGYFAYKLAKEKEEARRPSRPLNETPPEGEFDGSREVPAASAKREALKRRAERVEAPTDRAARERAEREEAGGAPSPKRGRR